MEQSLKKGVDIMSYSVRLVPYKGEQLLQARNHDGMISPEGEFYIVAERGDMDYRHDSFAEGYLSLRKNIKVEKFYRDYLDMHPQYSNIRFSYKDVLIHLFGFTNYEYRNGCAEIDVPNPKYAGYKMTDEQFRTLQGLVYVNRDSNDVLMQALRYEKGMEEMEFQYGKSFQKRR